jgi:hypothetical protein
MDFRIILALVVLLALALVAAMLKGGTARAPNVKRKDFMTKNELEFWRLLKPAAAPLHVGPQVAMGALLTTATGLDKSERSSARNSFAQKAVDFVLFDDAGVVQLIVELDDSTHVAAKDMARDKQTNSAGYRTLRVLGRDAKTSEVLTGLIAARLTPPALVVVK